MQGEFTSRSLPTLSPLSLFTHASNPEVLFEPTLFVPSLSPNSEDSFSEILFTSLGQLETTNAPFFSTYAWLSSSPLFRLLNSPLSFFSPKTYWGLTSKDLATSFPANNTIASPAVFVAAGAFTPVTHLLPTRALASLSLSGNKFYLIHRHLAGQQSTSIDTIFSGFNEHAPSYLPRGFLASGFNTHVVEASNLVSPLVTGGDLGTHFDNTG